MYKVCMLRYVYHSNTNLSKRRPVVLDKEFETLEDAYQFIDNLKDKPYILSNGEYSTPTYLVVDTRVAEWVKSGRNENLDNYDLEKCGCGECDYCLEEMIRQDRLFLEEHNLPRKLITKE